MIVVLVPKPELTGAVFSDDLINDFETVKIVTFDHHVTDRDRTESFSIQEGRKYRYSFNNLLLINSNNKCFKYDVSLNKE